MNKNGFILIELMIALSAIAFFSVMFGLLWGICYDMQHRATKQLEAATYAQNVIEQLYISQTHIPSSDNTYTVSVQTKKPFDSNFILATVTVAWRYKHENQSLELQGGWCE